MEASREATVQPPLGGINPKECTREFMPGVRRMAQGMKCRLPGVVDPNDLAQLRLPVFAAFILAAWPIISVAATPEQAKAFSERAAAYIKQVGEQKAFADFSRPDGGFVDGELYVFCYDRRGVNMAHGGNRSLLGRNLLHIKDPDGAEPNLLIVKMGFEQGRGWVDFKWPNPVTKRIEKKSAYIIRTNDVACGVGYYKD